MDRFLVSSPWSGTAEIFRRGPTGAAYRPIRKYSSLQIEVSPIDEDLLEPQVNATLAFLRSYEAEVRRLVTFPGVEAVEFRIGLFWLPDTAIYPISLTSSFLKAVGDVGASVDIYVYASDGIKTV
ncbi:DUF4279 domain-containing protein [Paraburkholderia ribeironis]|uniref:DUF4279 domain-containing protein n=1 Tax=Paraburkholderia ribeironis TaxID=1247936 RepID=UPI001FE842FE|nr:DUF4279 domain-containing protein [Paraburkholderia ribeironis]